MSAQETTLKKLQVVLDGNTAKLQSAMKQAEQQTQSSTDKIQAGLDKVDAAFKKVAKAAAAYISVKALVDFGKSCVELGSDLSEVQNVVDVTFGSMSKNIDEFSKAAIKQFGLSETAAKKYSSTMGAMLKSMGMNTNQAYEMSTTLTGLAGDLASFYNLSSDEAFSKLRSGISGETEPLKQLGINMSVANLEAYALSKGITTAYNSMTQMEQATLRYNYLLDTTKDAQGDFARTSDSWANQVKVLSMQFDSLKASIGQGLIMALTPVIKVINELMGKLVELGERFKVLMATITGTDLSTEASNAAESMAQVEESSQGVGESLAEGVEEGSKAVKRFLMSFDEIHKLQKDDNDLVNNDSLEALSDPATLNGLSQLNTGTEQENEALAKMRDALDAIKQKMQPVIELAKELGTSFKEGFSSALGDNVKERVAGIVDDVKSIGSHLKDIFTDPEVTASAEEYANKVARALGQITGAVANIGLSIAENIVGGIEKYLAKSSGRIKKFLTDMFTIRGDTVQMLGDFAESIGHIFEAFGGENGQQLTANILGIFSDAFMSVELLAEKLFRDIVKIFTQPIVLNTDGIKQWFDDVLGFAADLTGTIQEAVDFIGDKANEVYDEHVAPLFDSIANGLAEIIGSFLEVWNSDIKPMLDQWSAKISELWNDHLKPMFDALGEAFGALVDALKVIWENVLQPFFEFLNSKFIQYVLPVLHDLFNTTVAIIGEIADALTGLFEIIQGVIDFLVGVFTGDWDRAWKGIEETMNGFYDVAESIISGVLDLIAGLLDGIIDFFASLGGAIADGISKIVDWGKGLLGIEDKNPGAGTPFEGNGYTAKNGGIAFDAMQNTGANRDDMYGAFRDALDDTDQGDVNLYIDGEQLATATDRARSVRNTRMNPQLAW